MCSLAALSQETCTTLCGSIYAAQKYHRCADTSLCTGLTIALGAEIGIDIEDGSRIPKFGVVKFAQKKFHEQEALELKGIEEALCFHLGVQM